ncbi:MAG: hypothetical protein Q8922_10085 [Bacteroidota bacterium]|nr:hypothetical protein [Bacteroidota bacterium]MDP4232402.1 hypothetical protein [Bacteroidota bacterium]MDP4241539.1 hypothetical protein [Bacteroidota bacterium]MDP4288273.1 hypothetical protein [Bacteroidota bacterium]
MAWLGILAIWVQVNAVPLDYVLFRLNRDQIVRTQCERKMPHCNGHCYLTKQLAKNTSNAPSNYAAPHLDQVFLPSAADNLTLSHKQERTLPVSGGAIASGWLQGLLQPPRIG